MTDLIDAPSAVVVAVGTSAERGQTLGDRLATAFGVERRSVHIDDSTPSSAGAEGEGREDLTAEERLAAAISDEIPADALLVIESEHADRWRSRHSVAEHLIDAFSGPSIAIGPHAAATVPDGPILVALDGSESAEGSLATAALFATTFDRRLEFVRVVAEPLHPDPSDSLEESATAYLRERAETMVVQLDDLGVTTTVLTSNDPVSAISSLADQRSAGLVMLHSRGDRSTQRSSMSRTAAGLIADLSCPVMVTTS